MQPLLQDIALTTVCDVSDKKTDNTCCALVLMVLFGD